MRIAGISLAMIGILGGILLGGSIFIYVNIPSVVFVVLVGGGIIISAHGIRSVALTFGGRFGSLDADDISRVKAVAETGIQAFVAAGWIGVILGVVQMLRQMEDPSQLGSGTAVALLTALYGYILAYVFCLPISRSISKSGVG